jgi:hypothetical protein
LKSSLSTVSPNLPDILSTAVLHKRRPEKRVRFAVKLEPVEEGSLPSSREVSPSSVSKSNKRVIDPWRRDGPLYGAYIEYLDKQDALIPNEPQIRQSPVPPSEPESATYTHTFIIQSKSPELVIDSITVSTPPLHLPRIIRRTTRSNRPQLPAFDAFVKQQLTLSTAPRVIHTRKLTNSPNQNQQYSSVYAALKRAELSISPTQGLHPNNRISRPENNLLESKRVSDYLQSRKLTEVITRPLPGTNNQINHFSGRPTLLSYPKKARIHSRTCRPTDEANLKTPYFFQNHDNDHLLQPVIHSNR